MENDNLRPENIYANLPKEDEAGLERNRRIFKKSLAFFAAVFFIFAAFSLGFDRGKKSGLSEAAEANIPLTEAIIENKLPKEQKSLDFSIFWKVWDIVSKEHIDRDNLNAQEMVYGAINGMLKATGDPYSYFFNPKESREFSQDIEGNFEGIGAELGIKDQILTVIAPLDESPAQKAGVRAGDKILKIDDKISTEFTIDEAVDLIRGKKGTEVRLTILSEGAVEAREVKIVRDNIEVKTVKLDFKDENIAYLKLSKFGENTTREFSGAVGQIVSQKSSGIILDLRNNPGGLLDRAVDVASFIIPKGKIVVSEENSIGEKINIRTSGGDRISHLPLVVLVNEGSASASEILAGALRDNNGTALIGKKTFGKGSVQELLDLPGGASVKITIAKWLTPNGDNISEKGISPSIEVDLTPDDFENKRDPQLDKALETIKEKIRAADK